MSLVLRDVRHLDGLSQALSRGTLRVEDGSAGDTVIAGGGRLALPGFVCAHHHLYSALARGMPAPPRAPRNFVEILELVWWRLDRALDADIVRACARAAAIDALRCGVTCIVDHHSAPNAIPRSLDILAETLDEFGIAHVLCLELSDRDGPEKVAAGLAETERYLASGRPALVGLHASFTVGDSLLAEAVALARRHGTGLHLHVAEDGADQERCLAEHGRRVVHRLADAGALELPGTLLVHCLHIDDTERALLREAGTWVVQNPESNAQNGVGGFAWRGLDPGRMLLGTDGFHGDMLRSLRAAYFAGLAEGIPPDRIWGLLEANRRYLAECFPAAARVNDIVLLDYNPPTPLDGDTLPAHAIFGMGARHVSAVIAGGRMRLAGNELLDIDEGASLRFCREQAQRLWDRLDKD